MRAKHLFLSIIFLFFLPILGFADSYLKIDSINDTSEELLFIYTVYDNNNTPVSFELLPSGDYSYSVNGEYSSLSSNKEVYVAGLPDGDYVIKSRTSSSNKNLYLKNKQLTVSVQNYEGYAKFEYLLKEQGNENIVAAKKGAAFFKIKDTDGNPISDLAFQIKNSNNQTMIQSNGTAQICPNGNGDLFFNLEQGQYSLVAESNPSYKDSLSIAFQIENGKQFNQTIVVERLKKNKVTFFIKSNNTILSGALTFKSSGETLKFDKKNDYYIYNKNGSLTELRSVPSVGIIVLGLPEQKISVSQVEYSDGFYSDEPTKLIDLSDSNVSSPEYVFPNSKTLNSIKDSLGNDISSFSYSILRENLEVVSEEISFMEKGFTFPDIKKGVYYLRIDSVPDGYITPEKPFTLKFDGKKMTGLDKIFIEPTSLKIDVSELQELIKFSKTEVSIFKEEIELETQKISDDGIATFYYLPIGSIDVFFNSDDSSTSFLGTITLDITNDNDENIIDSALISGILESNGETALTKKNNIRVYIAIFLFIFFILFLITFVKNILTFGTWSKKDESTNINISAIYEQPRKE